MPKEKAESLATFFKENVKASVLEFKIDGNGLTVTTTPEVQNAIGSVAKLVSKSSSGIRLQMRFPDKKE
jgi:hypothetical protein